MRSRNTNANSLATLAVSFGQDIPWIILVEDLVRPAELEVTKAGVFYVKVRPSWMDLIVLFLREGVLPLEGGEAEKIRRKDPSFWLFEEQKLYKCFFSGPYLLCVHPEAVKPLWRNCMKESVEVTQEAGRCHIRLLLRVTGGQACKKKYKNMLKV